MRHLAQRCASGVPSLHSCPGSASALRICQSLGASGNQVIARRARSSFAVSNTCRHLRGSYLPNWSASRFCANLACYASDPARWQDDHDVAAYGKSLEVQHTEPGIFLEAAAALRARADLPADLRASAGRAQAKVLFQEALRLYQLLDVKIDAPWPHDAHSAVLVAVDQACGLYAQVLSESLDPELNAAVARFSAEWPAAVAATSAAYREVRKLSFATRMVEVQWLTAQIGRVRAAAFATRSGDSSAAQQPARQLREAGIPDADEKEMLRRTIGIAKCIIEVCQQSEGESDDEVKSLRARGQVLLMQQLTELALACACTSDMEEAVRHVLQALEVRPDASVAQAADVVQQLREVAVSVWEQQTRSAGSGTSPEALRISAELGAALANFNL